MNIHTPERQPNESQAEYRARRALSHKRVKAMRCVGLGNQHKAPSARQQLRDLQRRNGTFKASTYGLGILQPQRRRNQHHMDFLHRLRDESGAFTHVGRHPITGARRIWLGGISAQRGY